MKKLMFSALACVAFAFSGFASNEVVNEEKVLDGNTKIETENSELTKLLEAKNYCDLKFVTVNSDGEIVITIKRGYGYNLDCDKEQSKVDKLNEKKIGMSSGDFRNL